MGGPDSIESFRCHSDDRPALTISKDGRPTFPRGFVGGLRIINSTFPQWRPLYRMALRMARLERPK